MNLIEDKPQKPLNAVLFGNWLSDFLLPEYELNRAHNVALAERKLAERMLEGLRQCKGQFAELACEFKDGSVLTLTGAGDYTRLIVRLLRRSTQQRPLRKAA